MKDLVDQFRINEVILMRGGGMFTPDDSFDRDFYIDTPDDDEEGEGEEE